MENRRRCGDSPLQDEAGHILGAYDGTGKKVQETVYLGDWPVAAVRLNRAGTAVAYYVWPDHLGSPKQVTDPATNKVVWRWETNPFGPAPNPYEDPQGTGNTFVYNLRLPGQYWDKEISRSSNGYREYDPYLGRYIQSDPIGLGWVGLGWVGLGWVGGLILMHMWAAILSVRRTLWGCEEVIILVLRTAKFSDSIH